MQKPNYYNDFLDLSILLIISTLILFSCKSKDENKNNTIKQNVSAKEFYNLVVNNPSFEKNNFGESFAWHSAVYSEYFVEAYRAWQDTSWLNYGVKYYDFMLSKTFVGPDGYRGLIGPNFRAKNKSWSNEEVSDGLLARPLLEFAELVLADKELAKIYGNKANEYVEFAKKHIIEKWDKRNLYIEIGEYSDFIFGQNFMVPNNPSEWTTDSSPNPFMSQKYNIANKLGQVCLRLYRITKDEVYRSKAEKLFFRLKSDFQYFDNHYVWFYWSPFYDKDILFEKNNTNHWADIHPYRAGYKKVEVEEIVEAYHSGVVFSETDIKRIINTNMEVMWNKDFESPAFISCNGKKPDTTGTAQFLKKYSTGNSKKYMGTLWSSLIDFDDRVRKIYEHEIANEPSGNKVALLAHKIERAYFYNCVNREKPSFNRKFADGLRVIVKDAPFGNSDELTHASVIPYIIKKGENSFVVSKTAARGTLNVDLYSNDGKNKIANLYNDVLAGNEEGVDQYQMFKFDGRDKENNFSGKYRIRWTLNNKFREREIEIIK